MSENFALKRAATTAICGLENAGFDVISKQIENGIQLTITPKAELTKEEPYTYPVHNDNSFSIIE